ncbi:hypothetical protein CU102_12620 [Phyllobacterium brassicacearum]|uniref:Uncharacterized protein n=1 Tax=Phyllobacterium brassicacearum TaxID=314235 RepID=A0A2P7BQ60_9HYPH|nr:hypothetical protein CU102_12620 [Phyllobacterium brassicacearum]TDQ24149.1 hypothetical protein DEV91_11527 [Phyllobacterium brassicacearum]
MAHTTSRHGYLFIKLEQSGSALHPEAAAATERVLTITQRRKAAHRKFAVHPKSGRDLSDDQAKDWPNASSNNAKRAKSSYRPGTNDDPICESAKVSISRLKLGSGLLRRRVSSG